MSALLEIAWKDVQHLSIGPTEMCIALKSGGVRSYRFASAEMCDSALAAWCKTMDSQMQQSPSVRR